MALILLGSLAAASVADLRTRLIPNALIAAAAAIGLALLATAHRSDLVPGLAATGVAMLLFGTVALARPDGFGMGDAKLAAVIGLYLGPLAAPALMLGFAAAALAGLLLARRRRLSLSATTVPLAPFLAIGVLPVALPIL